MKLPISLEDKLKLQNVVSVQAHGNSMQPLIKNGQILDLKKIKPEEIYVGDIVVYKKNNSVVCHLVIAKQTDVTKSETLFITAGSNTKHDDIPVLASEILAKVTNVKLSKFKLLLWILRKKINF